jgi:hypothetical protein
VQARAAQGSSSHRTQACRTGQAACFLLILYNSLLCNC